MALLLAQSLTKVRLYTTETTVSENKSRGETCTEDGDQDGDCKLSGCLPILSSRTRNATSSVLNPNKCNH